MEKYQYPLYLAPMEGVGARPFRMAIATIGGFDEACTEFIRVPKNAHCQSLAKVYQSDELGNIPLAAQVMGSDPELTAQMALELIKRGAPRIDLNCGCPSNTVTGKGAGSSLLKDPKQLYAVTKAICTVSTVPVTVKLRSGYEDTSLFEDNLFAAQEAGAKHIALHPRTKLEGYKPPAHWGLIAKAKALLSIPVIGNGDILTARDAKRMIEETACDGLMIGRGAVINPWIFHEIRGNSDKSLPQLKHFLETFVENISEKTRPLKGVNQLKQLCGFLFRMNAHLLERRQEMLRTVYVNAEDFLSKNLPILSNYCI